VFLSTLTFAKVVSTATVKWHWQGKSEVVEEKPIAQLIYLPQIPDGVAWVRTRTSVLTSVTNSPSLIPELLKEWHDSQSLNSVILWLAVLFCIREVSGSKFYIMLTVHHVMILGKWPTWCTNSFLCIYFYL